MIRSIRVNPRAAGMCNNPLMDADVIGFLVGVRFLPCC